MNRIDLIIVYLLIFGVIASCSFDAKSKDSTDNQEKVDYNASDSDSVKVSKTEDGEAEEKKFEFQLLNDSVGRYLEKGTDFLIFIYTDSFGNIPYDTAMHKYLDIDGAGCYADKDERFTFLETPIKLNINNGIRFITSTSNFNIFIINNDQIGKKEFMLVSDSSGILKSFIEIKHSVWTKYCNAKRTYEILDNQSDFTTEFHDYVSRKDPDFRNEITGLLSISKSGEILIKYNDDK